MEDLLEEAVNVLEEVKDISLVELFDNARNDYLSKAGITVRNEGGVLRKTDFWDVAAGSMDDYSDLRYPPEVAQRINKHLAGLKTGMSAAVPIVCGGHICPFIERCPLNGLPESQFPLKRQCIVERELVLHLKRQYIEELQVDPLSQTELSIVDILVAIDIYMYRANVRLAVGEDGEWGKNLLREETVGVVPIQNRELTKVIIHPIVELIDRMFSRKMKILDSMVATRREKWKKDLALGGVSKDDDFSKTQASLKRKLESSTTKVDTSKDDIIRQALESDVPIEDDEERSAEDLGLI